MKRVRLSSLSPRLRAGLALLAAVGVNGLFVLLLIGLSREPTVQVRREYPPVAVLRQEAPPPPPPPAEETPPPPPDDALPSLELPDLSPPMAASVELDPLPFVLSALPSLGLPAPRVRTAPAPTGSRRADPGAAQTEPPAEEPPSGPLESDEVDQPPTERAGNPDPEFPRMAQRRELSGSVRVRMRVGLDGRVKEWSVLQTTGHRSFQVSVEKILPRLQFAPGQHRGQPVEVWVRKTFEFQWER